MALIGLTHSTAQLLKQRLAADPTQAPVRRRRPKGAAGGTITPNDDSFQFTERSYSCSSGSLIETATTYTVTIAIAADGTLTVTKV